MPHLLDPQRLDSEAAYLAALDELVDLIEDYEARAAGCASH